jgi:hypothetical protein
LSNGATTAGRLTLDCKLAGALISLEMETDARHLILASHFSISSANAGVISNNARPAQPISFVIMAMLLALAD